MVVAVIALDQLCLRSSKAGFGRQHVKSRIAGNDRVTDTTLPQQHLVHGVLEVVAVDTASHRGVGLWIKIDQQYPKTFARQRGGKIDGGGGFADTTLLVGDRDDPGQLLFSETSAITTICLRADSPGTSTGKTRAIARWRGVRAASSSSG